MFYVLKDREVVRVDDMMEWAMALEATRVVRQSTIELDSQRVLVSTVFLGLDHRFMGGGPPLVFETMVFGGSLEGHQVRHSSYDDALIGHAAARGLVEKATGNPDLKWKDQHGMDGKKVRASAQRPDSELVNGSASPDPRKDVRSP